MDNVISVKNLTQSYGRGRLIYENLSFDVPQGSILGLLGKNGTGKTTTINILMGFLKPQGGECRIFGEEITTLTPATRARIALLLEGHVQYSFMTISQIEKFYAGFYPKWNRRVLRADGETPCLSRPENIIDVKRSALTGGPRPDSGPERRPAGA